MTLRDGTLRHPEKRNLPLTPVQKKPGWLRVRMPASPAFASTRRLVRSLGLNTVCEEAACPNIGECWAQGHVTIMILGQICTRACAFCNVATGRPAPPDPQEPEKAAAMATALGAGHMVITSVDRDDLADGGAHQFARVIRAVRAAAPGVTIEVLVPDFLRKEGALETVLDARPDVFNHNLETVPGLYHRIRPGARYFHSLRLLQRARELSPEVFTKSGLMAGLGERRTEIIQVMDDMRSAGVEFLTIGQYLQPTRRHAPVDRFVTPEEFGSYAALARAKGFLMVSASPLTRSSYLAGEDFRRLQKARPDRTGQTDSRAQLS